MSTHISEASDSDTPLTDKQFYPSSDGIFDVWAVNAEFARELERDLTEAKSEAKSETKQWRECAERYRTGLEWLSTSLRRFDYGIQRPDGSDVWPHDFILETLSPQCAHGISRRSVCVECNKELRTTLNRTNP